MSCMRNISKDINIKIITIQYNTLLLIFIYIFGLVTVPIVYRVIIKFPSYKEIETYRFRHYYSLL